MDIRSNFGVRSSGIYNQLVSESISYMLSKIKMDCEVSSKGSWFLRTFFDDEVYVTDPEIAQVLYETAIQLHEILGIGISTSKDHVIPPTRTLLALGIVLDFDLGVMYMPAGKLEKLRAIIEEMKWKEVMSRVDLQRLLGLLNHWTEIIPAGRVFVNRLLQGFKSMSQTKDFFIPSESFRKDLRWWEKVAPHLNFQSMMECNRIGPEESIEMDASLSYCIAGVNHIEKEFFMIPVPKVIEKLPIHCTEMAALMLSVDVWSGMRSDPQSPGVKSATIFRSSRVTLKSDNQAVIKAVNNGHAKDEFLCLGIRYIHYQMALVYGQFDLVYVNNKDNIWADGLRRGK